jgi:inner membrane protein
MTRFNGLMLIKDLSMNAASLFARNRATLKLVFVSVLSLVMLIPLSMVRSIISERQSMQSSAQQTIAGRWGGSQVLSGLVAATNTAVTLSDKRGLEVREQWRAKLLSELSITVSSTTEQRYLGIYEVPVYSALVEIRGRIDWTALNKLQPEGDMLFWLPLGDVRGLREVSALKIGELEIPATPLNIAVNNNSGLQFTLPEAQRGQASDSYRLDLKVAGSQSILFLPLADTTRVTLDSDWPHPEFVGQFLPADRSIDDEGTRASWQLLGLNRPYGDQWVLSDMSSQQLDLASFGMRLETPVDGYQRSERSVKYGFLFITLTFFTLFLFEVMTGRPLHPVPYVLTGAALAVFYLVLLALSEYLSFHAAYAVAAVGLVLIVTPYTSAVLGRRRRGILVGAMLSFTYGLLFVLVSAQHLSLLFGSITLLLAIAGLMYLTREVDWYDYDAGAKTD